MAIAFNNINTDTTSLSFVGNGGQIIIAVRADNFGGGNITIESAPLNDPIITADPVDNKGRFSVLDLPGGVTTITDNKTIVLDYIPRGLKLRAVLAGSAGASNVFAEFIGLS